MLASVGGEVVVAVVSAVAGVANRLSCVRAVAQAAIYGSHAVAISAPALFVTPRARRRYQPGIVVGTFVPFWHQKRKANPSLSLPFNPTSTCCSSASSSAPAAENARRGSPKSATLDGAVGPQPAVNVRILRRLIMLRHAASSESSGGVASDHLRPLSDDGRRTVPLLATALQSRKGWMPQLILSSDSLRTRQTLELMIQEVADFGRAAISFLGSFYTIASLDGHTRKHIAETITQYASDGMGCVMCMGHNRGWEEAASELANTQIELKTANAALLESVSPTTSWEEAFRAKWRLVDVLQPNA
eukprot:jgi/Chlat1/8632/Chrsp86S08012